MRGRLTVTDQKGLGGRDVTDGCIGFDELVRLTQSPQQARKANAKVPNKPTAVQSEESSPLLSAYALLAGAW